MVKKKKFRVRTRERGGVLERGFASEFTIKAVSEKEARKLARYPGIRITSIKEVL